MSIFKFIRKLLVGVLGLMCIFPNHAQSDYKISKIENNGVLKAGLSKTDLSLKLAQLNSTPQGVKVPSAMCYSVAAPQTTITYQCSICGRKTVYSLHSKAGKLVNKIAYIKYKLKNFKISVDTKSFCRWCGEGRGKAVEFKTNCYDCGKEFSWDVKSIEEFDKQMGILFSSFEVGSKYINNHLYCPKCRQKPSIGK